ncbi:hypothetical protein KO507_18325 [Gilvimarinus agarilyticus]|uniref:DUF6786 family protein n=1 Tax=Gilvimarinus sp. 2_MG-2023 TaxID=3062666 RepID=UPI001C09A906|nr:DUF6786 family protein [Gilvimarinus sp. 2_MG-2023]MBU2887727.1 hypothetical protein [Gilvimarinus agarilyticus]MDO6572374.1 hypothetical protein [Gilvimarinus sp. 2_MG-2023]
MNKFRTLAALTGAIVMSASAAFGQTFDSDLKLMGKHFSPLVLKRQEQRVAVMGELQGRVMVTSLSGEAGQSIGWINRDYLREGQLTPNRPMGGADRLSFGPETGEYSLLFKPGVERVSDNISYPSAMTTQAYPLVSHNDTQAVFKRSFSLTNYSNTTFDIEVTRTIELLDNSHINGLFQVELPNKVQSVGFSVRSELTNSADTPWQKATGLLSLWHLTALEPGDNNTVVMPLKGQLDEMVEYFSPNLSSHSQIIGQHGFYNADGKYMNKIGIPPQNTQPIMGAWDAERELLTLVHFSFTPVQGVYVNSVWTSKPDPYDGDVINVFNDGIVDGFGPFGPFYELESSSHTRELAPGESLQHTQTTVHLQGPRESLDTIARQVLGVSLDNIEQVFNNTGATP